SPHQRLRHLRPLRLASLASEKMRREVHRRPLKMLPIKATDEQGEQVNSISTSLAVYPVRSGKLVSHTEDEMGDSERISLVRLDGLRTRNSRRVPVPEEGHTQNARPPNELRDFPSAQMML